MRVSLRYRLMKRSTVCGACDLVDPRQTHLHTNRYISARTSSVSPPTVNVPKITKQKQGARVYPVSRRNPWSLIKNAFRAGHWAFETCRPRDLHCWIKGIWDFSFAADLFPAIIVELRDRRKKYTRQAAGSLLSLFIFFVERMNGTSSS